MTSSLIDTIFLSEKRKNLLLLLDESPKNSDEIKKSLNVTSTSIMPQIKKLTDDELVIKKEGLYELSELGELIVEKMRPLLDTLKIIEENHEYWANRDLEVIPRHLLSRIDELDDCEIIEPELNSMFEPVKDVVDNLLLSRDVKIVSAFFRPGYPVLLKQLIEKGARISLILTESVFNRFQNDYEEELKLFMDSENTSLFICNCDLKLASAITERFMSLALFYKSGIFDHRQLITFNYSALKWGNELFSYYRQKSKEITSLD